VWDGYRIVAVKDRSRAHLISRSAKELTRDYATVVAAIARLNPPPAPGVGPMETVRRDKPRLDTDNRFRDGVTVGRAFHRFLPAPGHRSEAPEFRCEQLA
jgi:hypothetical protein